MCQILWIYIKFFTYLFWLSIFPKCVFCWWLFICLLFKRLELLTISHPLLPARNLRMFESLRSLCLTFVQVSSNKKTENNSMTLTAHLQSFLYFTPVDCVVHNCDRLLSLYMWDSLGPWLLPDEAFFFYFEADEARCDYWSVHVIAWLSPGRV